MKEIWILNHYASATSGRHYNFARLLNERGYSVKLFAASTVHGVGNNRIHGRTRSSHWMMKVASRASMLGLELFWKWSCGSLTWLTMPYG